MTKKKSSDGSVYRSLLNPKGVQVEFLLEFLSDIVYGNIGKTVRLGTALMSFKGIGTNGYTLSFEEGDTIQILKGGPSERKWQGVCYGGSTGTFPSSYVVEKSPKDWTSNDVIEYVVKPATKSEKSIFCEVYQQGYGKKVRAGKDDVQIVRKSTAYIIHSPEMPFYDLVHSIITHLKGKDLSREYVWLDIVCMNHIVMESMYESHAKNGDKGTHGSTLEDFLRFRIHALISKFDEFLISFNLWNKPKVLNRSYNLWELYGALFYKKPVSVILTSHENLRMLKTLASNYTETIQQLGQVNIRNSSPSLSHFLRDHFVDDAYIIKNQIEGTFGYDEVNDSINQFLRSWLGRCGLSALHWRKGDKKISSLELAHLSNQIGLQVWSELEWAPEAERLFREAVKKYQRSLGHDHKYVAIASTNLASVLAFQGKREEAIIRYKDAVVIRRNLPSEKLELARNFSTLAELLSDVDKLSVAEQIYHAAIDIWKSELGEEHVLVAVGYNNLGEMLRTQERFPEAEMLFKEGLRIMRKYCEVDNLLLVAVLYNNLGLLYETEEATEEAEKCYSLALKLVRKVSGEDHPDVALSLNNLASLLFTQKRYRDAEHLLRDSVEVKVKAFGKKHLVVAQGLENLATLLRMEKKYNDAAVILERALSIVQRAVGENHPRSKKCLKLLQSCQSKAGT